MEREEGRRFAGGSGSGSRPTPPAPPGSEPDDAELVARVREGDRRAFDALVRRHQERAFAVARRVVRTREEAEDLVQESFLRALDRLDSFQPGRPFAPWLLRIVVNQGVNRRRAERRRDAESISEDFPGHGEMPEERVRLRMLRERIERALYGLSEKQRLAIQLFELDGLSGREVAETLGMREATVRWTLHEARRRLRALLTEPGGEGGHA